MNIQEPTPTIHDDNIGLPPIPQLSPDERAAEMKRLSDLAASIERDRQLRHAHLRMNPTYAYLIELWDEYCNEYPDSLEFADFMRWLRRLQDE